MTASPSETYEFILRRKRHEAPTLAECSAIYERERDACGQGASTFPSDTVKIRRVGHAVPFARFSYNGRIWRDEPWTPDATPIFDNRIHETQLRAV